MITEATHSSPPPGGISGLEPMKLPGEGIQIDALVGGSGPPLLLLHGYPQTRLIWRRVAPLLMEHFTLVVPDLRGYGRSDKPADDEAHHTYSKRRMAGDQMATMSALGFDRFMVAGHDRGARVAYRLALDHPDAVLRLAILDVVPTADVFDSRAEAMMGLFHWSFLSQPAPFPERMLEAGSDAFLAYLFERWSGPGFVFDAEAMEDYVQCFRNPASITAGCADYRAAWPVDRLHDLADRGRRKLLMPVRVLWGDAGTAKGNGPLETWRNWTSEVTGRPLPVGHFLPEEAPAEIAQEFLAFFGPDRA